MTLLQLVRPWASRRWIVAVPFLFCCLIAPIGCGEEQSSQSSIPTDFAAKLEKEHPELFEKKVGKGKKTEKIEGRDKRAIIRREYQKSLQQGAQ